MLTPTTLREWQLVPSKTSTMGCSIELGMNKGKPPRLSPRDWTAPAATRFVRKAAGGTWSWLCLEPVQLGKDGTWHLEKANLKSTVLYQHGGFANNNIVVCRDSWSAPAFFVANHVTEALKVLVAQASLNCGSNRSDLCGVAQKTV